MVDNKSELVERLKSKLREIFQFENEDLDFGIYRIMNYKRKEIEKFIEKELIDEIKKQLKLVGEEERENVEKELKEISFKNGVKKYLQALEKGDEERARIYREDFAKDIQEYERLKKELEEVRISEGMEKEIYNHLINFFSRYYDKGDFISKRRYGRNEKYIVPYNGEEVLLYWANKDQYYIKTTEYFRKYTFKVRTLIVNFRVVEAEEEKGNVKSSEKKFFVLHRKGFDFSEEKNELNIYFEYRGLTDKEKEKYKHGNTVSQDKANEETIMLLQEKIPQNSPAGLIFDKDPSSQAGKSYIEKHLYRYTRRNTTDYFIHKDLKGFLERELDFYIKNEFLHLEDLQVLEQDGYFDTLRVYLIGSRVFRNIALKIIEFLAQIENFQKKLWEKKKFVIDTHYVITLDKIKECAGEEFLESVLDEILSNERQKKEWKELFGIEVKNEKDLIVNNTVQGKEWKKLPIDTRYFGEEFKWKLLVALTEKNNLDEILDGVLIKSENFQALNLLLNKYYGKVQTIYIDPPFNSPSTEILYKNDYKHASWLCLMENRISLSKNLLSKEGIFEIAIDFNEQERLGMLVDSIWGTGTNSNNKFEKMLLTIIHNPKGRQGTNFSITHEYMYVIYPNIRGIISKEKREGEWRNLRDHGGESERHYAKNCFYPILIRNGEIVGFGDVADDDYHPENKNILREDGSIEVWPIDDAGVERKWRYARISVEKIRECLKAKKNGDYWEIFLWKEEYPFKTVWTNPKYSATDHGTKIITHLFGMKGSELFTFPKSIYLVKDAIYASSGKYKNAIVLDFFAGSGTTAHAVMKLNKEDNGKRKFILIEMADYFDTVIIPRIKKVAYSFNWKEGRPQDMDGIGVFFKYHTLEQYEDALENIEFEQPQKSLYELPDYFVKYMLEWETKNSKTFLDIGEMEDPFNYKLKIIEDYQQKTVNVDLIETFNYLLGLNVGKYRVLESDGRKYVFVFGERKGRKTAVIWRSTRGIDLEKDRKVIEEGIKDFEPDEVYVNGDAVVEGFKPIEPLFKSLMFERVD